jgi:hypothetical protein
MTNFDKQAVHERIDVEFKKIVDKMWNERIKNDLESANSRDLSVREATRMIPKTESWNKVWEELISRPRKKNE